MTGDGDRSRVISVWDMARSPWLDDLRRAAGLEADAFREVVKDLCDAGLAQVKSAPQGELLYPTLRGYEALFGSPAAASGQVVKPQELPVCWKYPLKLCPGECQYLLLQTECIHDRPAPPSETT